MVKKVIVIDDEYSISGLLFQHLSKRGYDVVALTNGAWITEGLIKTEGVDIIVTDYHMKIHRFPKGQTRSVMNGDEIIRYLRDNNYRGKIVLSSSVDISSMKLPQVDAIIEKPFTLDEFTKVIEGLS
ncbi:MAG: response regulator [Thermodesulfovibrionales bacterium]